MPKNMKTENGEEICHGLYSNAKKSVFDYKKTKEHPNAEKHLKQFD